MKCKTTLLYALLLDALISFVGPAYAGEIDSSYIGQLLFDAHRRNDWLPDVQRLNANLSEPVLYKIQNAYVKARLDSGETIGGFKGGFIPKAPVGGVLFGGDKTLHGKPEIALKNFKMLIIEAEIGFRFCQSISSKVASIEDLKNKVCEIMPVIEIADGAIADFGEVKKDFNHLRNTLISINVASSHTLLGQPHPANFDLSNLPVSIRHNDELIGDRDLDRVFDFWTNVLLIVNDYVLNNGYAIEPGHFIIGGNLTGIHVAKAGTYRANFGALGSLSLTVK